MTFFVGFVLLCVFIIFLFLSFQVPLVTFPQRHLRGRMAAVFFKHMALHEVDPDIATCCVADSVSDYVSKAIRLASDPNYRTRVRYGIKERSHRIFNEKSVSFEWGKFLTRALGVKISDDELYLTIGYVPEDRHHQSYISKVVEYEQSRWEKSAMLASILGPN